MYVDEVVMGSYFVPLSADGLLVCSYISEWNNSCRFIILYEDVFE